MRASALRKALQGLLNFKENGFIAVFSVIINPTCGNVEFCVSPK
ncbi:hypothetical protein PL11201_550022 [Planktothrix sp. PCC 11201]|nr:hypothetical protein PL11201_550022 [Planktothrix sp. PCC 11201]